MTVVRSGWSFIKRFWVWVSVENHRAVVAKKHAVFQNQFQRSRADELLYITSRLRQILWRVRVVHGNNLLNDDGAFVELVGDKVRRGANDLYSALKRLVVGPCADERRKKRMMNIDDARRES